MFPLTRQERQILGFLAFIFLIGQILEFTFKKNPKVWDMVNLMGDEQFYPKADVNHAPLEELVEIPGIGPATAERIIEYRQKHGPFTDLQQIKSLQGMTPSRFQKIQKYLKISRNPK